MLLERGGLAAARIVRGPQPDCFRPVLRLLLVGLFGLE